MKSDSTTSGKTGNKSDLLWGVTSQALQYGAALLLLPVMVTRLTSEEVGFWFVLMAVQALVSLLDFGFSPTFARNFTFVFSGSQELRKEGISEKTGHVVNLELLASLVGSAKFVYVLLAGAAAIVLLCGGSWYIHLLLQKAHGLRDPVLTWLVFCGAALLNIYFSWQSALLLGAQRIRANYQVGIANRAGMLIAGWAGLVLFPSLLSVAIAYLIGVIASRILAWYFSKDLLSRLPRTNVRFHRETINAIWHGSSRMGLVTLGAFLINRYSVFVVSYYYGLAGSASYSLALQMFAVAAGMAQVAFTAYLPRIAACRVNGDRDLLRQYFIRSNWYAWSAYLSIALGVIFFGDRILMLIHSKTALPGFELLILIALVSFLECNHANAALVITTENQVPFVPAALYSGLAIFLLSTLAGWSHTGIWSVVAAQGIVQAAYNNWQWPLRVHRELKIRWQDYCHALVTFFPHYR